MQWYHGNTHSTTWTHMHNTCSFTCICKHVVYVHLYACTFAWPSCYQDVCMSNIHTYTWAGVRFTNSINTVSVYFSISHTQIMVYCRHHPDRSWAFKSSSFTSESYGIMWCGSLQKVNTYACICTFACICIFTRIPLPCTTRPSAYYDFRNPLACIELSLAYICEFADLNVYM